MSIYSKPGRRMVFITGNTHDSFYAPTLERSDLNGMIHDALVASGFKRIVCYHHSKKIYFHDDFSKKTTIDVINARPQKALPPTRLSGGPMGDIGGKMLKSPETVAFDEESLNLGRFKDALVLKRLDGVIRDTKIKTAVIIDNADQFIRFFGSGDPTNASVPMLNAIFNDWENLGTDNRNIVIFVFPNRYSPARMEEDYRGRDIWTTYMRKYFDRKDFPDHVIDVGMPSKGEIRCMLNHYRILRGLKTDMQEIGRIVEAIHSHLFRQNIILRDFELTLDEWIDEGFTLTAEAVDKRLKTLKVEDILDSINQLIGMESFKSEVDKLVKRHAYEAVHASVGTDQAYVNRLEPRKAKVSPKHARFLHYAFLGNPGTGKTTAAKLLGQLLAALGYLPSDRLLKVTRSDLVGEVIGETEVKTREIIDKQMGGVLFIDEAYALHIPDMQNDYGKIVIDTLVDAMSEHMGEFSVILAGYTDKIEAMLRDANPGLSERIGLRIHIDDFSPDQLFGIFRMMSGKQGFAMTESFQNTLRKVIQGMYDKRMENWANARVLEKMLSAIENYWPSRPDRELTQDGLRILKEGDIPPEYMAHHFASEPTLDEGLLEDIGRLNGGKQVVDIVRKLSSRLRVTGKTAEPGHFCFIGSPGTGKTTVARKLGLVFKSMGVLKSGHFVEVSANQLIGDVVGLTMKKTTEKLREALDGVLFIDEVYAISENEFANEAINVINDHIEKHRNRMCVIFAGYQRRIEHFLDRNEGLRSRIDHMVHFGNLAIDELMDILHDFARQEDLGLSDDFLDMSRDVFIRNSETQRDFGNARFVRTYFKHCADNTYHRLDKEGLNASEDARPIVVVSDIPDSYLQETIADEGEGDADE
jgi:SpoVK/Ycf46/Vps4 family AAA+-type ATPase